MLGRLIYHFFVICWHTRVVYLALLAFMALGAGFFAMVENMPIGEALYFSFITGLTIGYGDIIPTTTIGRIVGVASGFGGVLFTGLIVAVTVRAIHLAWEEFEKSDSD